MFKKNTFHLIHYHSAHYFVHFIISGDVLERLLLYIVTLMEFCSGLHFLYYSLYKLVKKKKNSLSYNAYCI